MNLVHHNRDNREGTEEREDGKKRIEFLHLNKRCALYIRNAIKLRTGIRGWPKQCCLKRKGNLGTWFL